MLRVMANWNGRRPKFTCLHDEGENYHRDTYTAIRGRRMVGYNKDNFSYNAQWKRRRPKLEEA